MRTRYKKMSDYGISQTETEQLFAACRSLNEEDLVELRRIADEYNPPVIAEAIVISLTTGKGYNALNKESRIPLKRDDFYGHRRRTIANFYHFMVQSGRWTPFC